MSIKKKTSKSVRKGIIVLVCMLLLLSSVNAPVNVVHAAANISLDSSFEGGNGTVNTIDNANNSIIVDSQFKNNDTINVQFYFKISGLDTSTAFKFKVNIASAWSTPDLARYSYDKVTWYTVGKSNGWYSKTYSQSTVYFSSGVPYTYTDMTNFVTDVTNASSYATSGNVSTSELGRAVKYLKITDSSVSDTGKYLIWVVARQHAQENPSNYVIEGYVNFLISSDQKAVDLRKKAIIYVVPMIDVDGAYLGASGKGKNPHDYNRDWDYETPTWNVIRDVRQKIADTSASNPFLIFWDSHCPNPGEYGTTSRMYYYHLFKNPPGSLKYQYLSDLISYFNSYEGIVLPSMGGGTEANNHISTEYINNIYRDSLDISLCTETGFSLHTNGTEWTASKYRNAGQNMGKAMSDYLSAKPTPTITPTPGPTATPVFNDDFEDGNSNGWTVASGTWSVLTDGTKVYKQTNSTGSTRSTAGNFGWTNYAVEAKVKIYTVGPTPVVDLIGRYVDASNYYLLRLDYTSDTLLLYKQVNGNWTTLESISKVVNTNTWYTLKLLLNGSMLEGYVNGVRKLWYEDSSLSSGCIGVKGLNCVYSVDDVKVWTIPTPLIVDNSDAGYAETGTWNNSSLTGYNGTNTRYSSAIGSTAKWTPTIPSAGAYKVYIWYPYHFNSATNAKYTITYNGGSSDVYKDQTLNADQWTLLGAYNFAAGTGGYVTLNVASSNTRTDAVKFEPILFSDNFEDGNSTGWTAVSGTWSVVTDGTKVCKRTDTTGTGLSYAGTSTWDNYTVESRIKIYNAGATALTGILARYSDSSNYYMFRIHEGSDKVQLFKNVAGNWAMLQETAMTIDPNTWYTLKLVLNGTSLTGYVDDVQKVSVTDATFTTGCIGIRGIDTAFAADDIIVY